MRRVPLGSAKPAAAVPVLLVVLPGVLLLDLAGIAEPLRVANECALAAGVTPPFQLSAVAPGVEQTSSLALRIAGCAPLPPTLPGDEATPAWVIVVGTASKAPVTAAERDTGRAAVIDWLQHCVQPALAAGRARLWTVCSGALTAAAAGLFDGRQCTTHHELIDTLRQLRPQAHVLDNRIYVIDGPVASSAGITAGIDLALAAIQQHCGDDLAARVARELVVYWRRAGADPQLSPLLEHRNHLHSAVHRVQDAVLADPAADWSLPRLAAQAHVSPRHLRRLFQQHAGINPLRYVQQLRVALARQWLQQGRFTLEQVAERVGFASARQLRAAWKQQADDLPGAWRRSAKR